MFAYGLVTGHLATNATGALALDDGEAHSAHTVSASPALERGYRRVEIDFYANSSPGYLLLECYRVRHDCHSRLPQ